MRLPRRIPATTTTTATTNTGATSSSVWYVRPAAGASATVHAPRAGDVAKVA